METGDTITIASDGEDSGGRSQRRTRKLSEKARQNENAQNLLDMALSSTKKQPGSGIQVASAQGSQAKKSGKNGEFKYKILQIL